MSLHPPRDGSCWIAAGAFLAAVGVVLGAFAAHGLEERLVASGELESWRTAVRYQVWHALALVLFGLFRSRRPGSPLPGLAFLLGALLFSGSIYLLSLDLARSLVWPLTPLGALLLIVGWLGFGVAALRPPQPPPS